MKYYVHEKHFTEKTEGENIRYKKNGKNKKTGKDYKIGDLKDPKTYKIYKDFYDNSYKKMRENIENYELDKECLDKYFVFCEEEFSNYWKELLNFMKVNKISNNSKLHTDFLEEFSIYFLNKIPGFEDFDIFTKDVFAGLNLPLMGS